MAPSPPDPRGHRRRPSRQDRRVGDQVRVLVRGLTLRCPACGSRGIIRRWFSAATRCPRCAHPFEREEGFWVGALILNTIATFGLLFVVILVTTVATAPDIPVGALLVATVSIAVVVPVAFFPVSRTLWSAIDLLLQPPSPADEG